MEEKRTSMRVPVTDHEEIRRWAAANNAVPAEVFPHVFESEPAILRFIIGSAPAAQPELRPISWESFFAQFDLLGLAFVSQLLQIEEKSAYRFEGKPI